MGILDFHLYALAGMVFGSTFLTVKWAYKASFINGKKKIISCVSSIHKLLGELQYMKYL